MNHFHIFTGFHGFLFWILTCSCCWRARSICCRCFSICEAASFFCSSWAARSCSRKLISWVIMVESCRSFSARLSGVPKCAEKMYCKYEIDEIYQVIFTKELAESPTCLFQVAAWIYILLKKNQKNVAHSFATLLEVEDITKTEAKRYRVLIYFFFFLAGEINDATCTNPYLFSI